MISGCSLATSWSLEIGTPTNAGASMSQAGASLSQAQTTGLRSKDVTAHTTTWSSSNLFTGHPGLLASTKMLKRVILTQAAELLKKTTRRLQHLSSPLIMIPIH